MSTQEKHITSLMSRQRVPFEKDVLKFLLKHEARIVNPVVRSFIRRYVKWLYDCVNQEVTILPGGAIELVRWTSKEGGSYGYDPASIGFYLYKLNEIFFTVMGNAYIRITQQETLEDLPPLNMQLSIEMLKGLSTGLGFYVLAFYFTTDAPSEAHGWVHWACDLFGEFRDLETWRPDKQVVTSKSVRQVLRSEQLPDVPYHHAAFPKFVQEHDPRTYKPPEAPTAPSPPYDKSYYVDRSNWDGLHLGYKHGFSHGFKTGHRAGYDQCMEDTSILFSEAAFIIECERKRLVDFLRSLRQTLGVLNDDPLMVEAEVQVATPDGKPTNGYRADSQGEE